MDIDNNIYSKYLDYTNNNLDKIEIENFYNGTLKPEDTKNIHYVQHYNTCYWRRQTDERYSCAKELDKFFGTIYDT